MISKTIGYNGVHNIFRHTQMVMTAGWFSSVLPVLSNIIQVWAIINMIIQL